jgi:predicted phosphodiesterase
VCQVLAQTPENYKIAFIGDQGLGENAKAVLRLIKAEGADAVLHQGDLDYERNPKAWDDQINSILGPNFPYFASIGNHDINKWQGSGGYEEYLAKRMSRIGVTWDGKLGIKSSLKFKGIFVIFVAPDVAESGHADYIEEKFGEDDSIWRISSWHKNMRDMQVEGKTDQAGWAVYEESRKAGSIIATAHAHTYSRTYLLGSMENKTVVNKSDTLDITKGRSFVFVSGLGGHSIRKQRLSGNWWSSIYTSKQGANYGALFGIFNLNGNDELAEFYFKDIDGKIADRFWVVSHLRDGLEIDNEAPAPPKDISIIIKGLPHD